MPRRRLPWTSPRCATAGRRSAALLATLLGSAGMAPTAAAGESLVPRADVLAEALASRPEPQRTVVPEYGAPPPVDRPHQRDAPALVLGVEVHAAGEVSDSDRERVTRRVEEQLQEALALFIDATSSGREVRRTQGGRIEFQFTVGGDGRPADVLGDALINTNDRDELLRDIEAVLLARVRMLESLSLPGSEEGFDVTVRAEVGQGRIHPTRGPGPREPAPPPRDRPEPEAEEPRPPDRGTMVPLYGAPMRR